MIILKFIQSMMPFMLMSIPAFLIIRFLYLKYIHPILKLNLYHESTLLIYAVFICGLFSITCIPNFIIGEQGIVFLPYSTGSINLIPFKFIANTYISVFKNHNMDYFLINVIGNIVMFMPFGFFPALLWHRISLPKAALTGFLFSAFVEISQIYIGRNTDIDDIMLNTLGAVIGFFLYKLLKKRIMDATDKFKMNPV